MTMKILVTAFFFMQFTFLDSFAEKSKSKNPNEISGEVPSELNAETLKLLESRVETAELRKILIKQLKNAVDEMKKNKPMQPLINIQELEKRIEEEEKKLKNK